jgi:putative redox protein
MVRAHSLPGAYRTLASNGRHEIIADGPTDKGGGGTGLGAHDLLECSLAVCINVAVRMHAAQHSMPLEKVTTQVQLQRPSPNHVVFECSMELHGPLSSEQRHALQLAAEACPVSQIIVVAHT